MFHDAEQYLYFLNFNWSLPPLVPFFLPSKNITFPMGTKREYEEFVGYPRIKLLVRI